MTRRGFSNALPALLSWLGDANRAPGSAGGGTSPAARGAVALLALAGFVPMPAFAAEAPPGAGCSVKCEKLKPVHVLLFDPTITGGGPDRFQMSLAEVSGVAPTAANVYRYPVRARGEIPVILGALAAECKRIKSLTFSFHGSPGELHFMKSGQLTVSDVQSQLGAVACAMAPNARIGFVSCDLGAGCRGEDFMQAIGRVLLPKGGKVTAATDLVVVNPLSPTEPWALNGRWQSLGVEPGPRIRGLDSFALAPISAKECVAELDREIAHLEKLAHTRRFCWGESSKKAAQELRTSLLLAKGTQAALMMPYMSRVGTSPLHIRAAEDYARAVGDFADLIALLYDPTQCAADQGMVVSPPAPRASAHPGN